MGKPFKIILAIIAAIAALMIAAACILPFVIDANDLKPGIAAAVKEKTGRELAMDGDLKLSLIPWLGISTGKIALSNAPGFQYQPFAAIEEIRIEVRLLPLLSKKIEIGHIAVNGLTLNLARNKQGAANWPGLTGSGRTQTAPALDVGAQNQPPAPAAALAAFAISGITVENARINWDDLNADRHFEIKVLNLNADKFSIDQPVAVAASLTVSDSGANAIEAVKLNTELTVNKQLDIFSLRHSDVQIIASGEAIPGKSLTASLAVDDLALNMSRQTAKISGLRLKSGDMALAADLTGNGLKDKPSFQGTVAIASFSPAKLMPQLAAMQDAKLSIDFDLAATADSIELKNLAMLLDDSRIKGAVGIKDFVQPALSFNLDADALDLDHYLPPADKASKPIVGPTIFLAAGFLTLPLETLKKLNAEGTVSLGKFKANDLSMQGVHIGLNAKNGIIGTQLSAKQFYQGAYSGNLRIDAQGGKPVLAVNEKIEGVQIEPLLKDFNGTARISGTVDASAQLQGQGSKIDELKASVSGQLSFLFKDGAVKGFNLQKIIDEGKALINKPASAKDYKNDQTLFSVMSGTATIANGLIRNNDLVAKSPKLRVDGKGNINLNSAALDYKVDAQLLDSDAPEPDRVKGAVAINIGGTWSKPSYTVDIASLLTDKNKAKLDKLINKLDKKIGPGLGNLLKGFLK